MAMLTQKAIMSTFQQMLEEMPFDKITVSALVKRSGVSSNTFYYHYRDIYELLDVWMHRFLSPAGAAEITDWKTFTKQMLNICKENQKITYHICNSLSREQLERYIFSVTDEIIYENIRQEAEGRKVSDEQIQEIAQFIRFAFVGFMLKFIWDRMEADVTVIVNDIGRLFDNFVKSSIEMYDREN